MPSGEPLARSPREPARPDHLLGFADAVQVAALPADRPPGAELHLLMFILDREAFGVPVRRVREVIRVTDITRVPQAPPFIRGVTNLRGRILPVVEIRGRLGLREAVITPRSRIVVVDLLDRVLGLVVDAVSEVIKIPADCVAPAPPEVLSHEADYITGVARCQSRLIILLDLDKVLLSD